MQRKSTFTYDPLILSAEQQLIQFAIQRRKIPWLCHFTPRANLDDIRYFGLWPRNLLNNVQVTDKERYDRHSNAICLSISKPNKRMFNNKQKQGFDLCLLLINPTVLYEKNCLFFPHNAATASYRSVTDEQLQGEKALEQLFAKEVTFQKSGREPNTIQRSDDLKECETTSDQAEVQCLDVIEPMYIEHIIESNIPLELDDIRNYILIRNHISRFYKATSQTNIDLSEHKNQQNSKSSELERAIKWKQLNEAVLGDTEKTTKTNVNNEINSDVKSISTLLGVNSKLSKEHEITPKPIQPIRNTEDGSKSRNDNGCLGFIILVIIIFIFIF